MKGNVKKIIASAGALAIVAMNVVSFTANAAGLTVASTAYDDGTDTITVTVAGKNFTTDNVTTFVLRDSIGAAVAGVDATDVTEANGSFTVTDLTNLNGLATGNYNLSFITANGDFSAAMVYVNNANVVQVSATVIPTLSMALDTNSLALGNLSTSTYNSAGVTVTVSTNSVNGTTVAVGSTGLKDTTIGREIGVTDIDGGVAQTSAADFYKISTNGTPVLADGGSDINTAAGNNMLASQNVFVTTGPVDAAATLVTVGARAAVTTEAGNYTDNLTFTVTGTF